MQAQAAFYIPPGAVTSSKLNAAFISGLTAVSAEQDDYVSIADTSDSSNKKKALVSSIKNNKYRSVTTTDAPSVTVDETLKLSGASFTVTLPTAVGNTGKRFTLVHAGTSLTQVYTLATTSSQTIGGIASGSYALYTNGEVLTIESDNANWMIVNHTASTGWTDAGAISLAATGTALTKGTINKDKVYWRRRGSMVQMRFEYRQTAAGSAGTGIYVITIPTGLVIDTTNFTASTDITSDFSATIQAIAGGHGSAVLNNTAGRGFGQFQIYSTTQLTVHSMISFTAANVWGAAIYALNNTAQAFAGDVELPITGWQP